MIPPEAWWVTAALAVAIAEMKTAVLVNMLMGSLKKIYQTGSNTIKPSFMI